MRSVGDGWAMAIGDCRSLWMTRRPSLARSARWFGHEPPDAPCSWTSPPPRDPPARSGQALAHQQPTQDNVPTYSVRSASPLSLSLCRHLYSSAPPAARLRDRSPLALSLASLTPRADHLCRANRTKTAKRRPGAHRSHAHAALAAWPTPPLRADIPRLRVGCGLHIPYALRGVAPKDVCACEDHNPTPLPPRQGPPPDYAGWETVEVTA